MLLLQFSTSHYCRKARLVLGYKQIPYTVENLTPGFHLLKLKPLTGLSTVPVLVPQHSGAPADAPRAIADSTAIWKYLEAHTPQPVLTLPDPEQQQQAERLEDWFDESIGTATRFVYYDFRAKAGKTINPSFSSQIIIQIVRQQYGITPASVQLAQQRLSLAIELLEYRWQTGSYLITNQISIADLTAAALLSPLALIPAYRQTYPWLFTQIANLHQICGEPLPPGLSDAN